MQGFDVLAWQFLRVLRLAKCFAVIPEQAVLGSNPDQSGAVLQQIADRGVLQSLVLGVIFECVGLRLRRRCRKAESHSGNGKKTQRLISDESAKHLLCFSAITPSV